MKLRDPFALPARQRKSGPHKRLRLQEEREDEAVDKNLYTSIPCKKCGGSIVYEIGGEIPICPQCGYCPLVEPISGGESAPIDLLEYTEELYDDGK